MVAWLPEPQRPARFEERQQLDREYVNTEYVNTEHDPGRHPAGAVLAHLGIADPDNNE